MITLIGLTGKKRAGKSTVGDILIRHLEFYGISYAFALKEFVKNMYYPHITEDHVNGELKEEVIEALGVSARYLLCEIGDTLREIDGSIWLRPIEGLIVGNPHLNLVVTDVRYDNEVTQVRRLGGEIWRIEREGLPFDPHRSENSITLPPDRVIHNNGTLEDLENEVAHIWTE